MQRETLLLLTAWMVWMVTTSATVAAPQPPALEQAAREPVKYVGSVQPSKAFYDGGLRHAVGVHHYQVVRANRSHPAAGGAVGWTYNHQPFLAYWRGKFYVQYLSDLVAEHTPPSRTLIATSTDGRRWTDPIVVFPVYTLPAIRRGAIRVPAGMPAVMHQRMGFYVAPNQRLLTLAFYSYCATPRYSPNTGHGLGRVVREIHADGSRGPIYFIRYNRHAGWNETNTAYPPYTASPDRGFVAACQALLADPLMTLQWWEEDRGKDGFFAIDPSRVAGHGQAATVGEVTSSAGAGKALCFYHRPDGIVVGLWKNQWAALSPDNGKSWTDRVRCPSLMTCGAKVWGQRTDDGKYALIYDHSATRRNRFPLAIMTSEDGCRYDHIRCLQGEVPPTRYQGIHKNPGPQYIRGIVEGNGNPPGQALWNTYSMNKEDIWVARTRVPVLGAVRDPVHQDFQSVATEADLEYWNVYLPKWARVRVVGESGTSNRCLELRDEAPYDYARIERAFPKERKVRVGFRVNVADVPLGHALEFEVQSGQGKRPMRLRFDRHWLGLDRAQVFPLEPVPIKTGSWYTVELALDCVSQSYDLVVNDETVRRHVAFAEKTATLERLVFRTGPYRGDVRAVVREAGEPKPAGLYSEDRPGADQKVAPSVYLIDDVWTRNG